MVLSFFEIIFAFEKFTNQRNFYYHHDILVFESSDINFYSKDIYQRLNNYNNLKYCENPLDEDILDSLKELSTIGNESWLKKQKSKWTCQNCDTSFYWYDKVCKNCNKPVDGLDR